MHGNFSSTHPSFRFCLWASAYVTSPAWRIKSFRSFKSSRARERRIGMLIKSVTGIATLSTLQQKPNHSESQQHHHSSFLPPLLSLLHSSIIPPVVSYHHYHHPSSVSSRIPLSSSSVCSLCLFPGYGPVSLCSSTAAGVSFIPRSLSPTHAIDRLKNSDSRAVLVELHLPGGAGRAHSHLGHTTVRVNTSLRRRAYRISSLMGPPESVIYGARWWVG